MDFHGDHSRRLSPDGSNRRRCGGRRETKYTYAMFERSSGIKQLPGEEPRLSYESQIPPTLTIKEMKKATFERPPNFIDGSEISLWEEIVFLEGCAFWTEAAWRHSAEAVDALWRTYTASLTRTLMNDLAQKSLSVEEEENRTIVVNPPECRTG